jgi:hypothetical protein
MNMGRKTYSWVTAPEQLDWARIEAASSIPVLLPAGATRRRRWSAVLAWYGLSQVPAARVQEPGRRPRGNHWIVGVDSDATIAAAAPARFLKRRLASLDSIRECAVWIRGERPRTLIVAGRSDAFTANALADLESAAEETGVSWGVMTGVDLPALSFVAAKMIAAHGLRGCGRTGAIDALSSYVREDGRERLLDRAAADRVLKGSATALTILAHGEGSHVDLGSLVLCGLAGDRELSGDRVVPGCTRGRCCKRSNGRSTVHTTGLRTGLLVLLSCNGFCVAEQLYPSNVSIALASAEGYPAAFLSTTRRLAFHPPLLRLLHQLIDAGRPLGEIAALLNELRPRRGPRVSFVLLGDPLWRATSRREEAPAPRVLPVDADATYALAAPVPEGAALLRGGSRAVVLSSSPKARLQVVGDASTRTIALLSALAERSRAAGAIEHAIGSFYGRDAARIGGLRSGVLRLASARRRVDVAVFDGLREAELRRQDGIWDALPEDLAASARRACEGWDAAFADLVEEHLGDTAVFDLVHHFHRCAQRRSSAPCARCGSRTERSSYVTGALGLPPRVGVECPVCGPLREHAKRGPSLVVAPIPPTAPGESRRLEVAVRSAPGAEDVVGTLIFELADKARGTTLYKRRHDRVLSPSSLELVVPVPQDAGFDLHTMRLTWIGLLDVAFCRARLAAVPS